MNNKIMLRKRRRLKKNFLIRFLIRSDEWLRNLRKFFSGEPPAL